MSYFYTHVWDARTVDVAGPGWFDRLTAGRLDVDVPAAATDGFDVFLLAGDGNMVGGTGTATAADRALAPGVLQWAANAAPGADVSSTAEPALLAAPPTSLGLQAPDTKAPERLQGRQVWLVHPWTLRAPPADLPSDTMVIGVFPRTQYHYAHLKIHRYGP